MHVGTWADLGASLMLITAALHFKGAQILTALRGEKLRPCPLMRSLRLSRHHEIVSVSMNLDENLCTRANTRGKNSPQIPSHYWVSFVLGTGRKYECWVEFLDSQDESEKLGFTRAIVSALPIALSLPQCC